MNWKKHLDWKTYEKVKDKIKPGDMAKLISEDSDVWTENAWIIGLSGNIFEILEISDGIEGHGHLTVKVPFDIWKTPDADEYDGENDEEQYTECSFHGDKFLYKLK